jgi:hypothetical protein
MQPRKRLSDILHNTDREKLARTWATTQAADDLLPLPTGEYVCRILNGEATTSKSGTPGYKLTLEVTEGDHAGRRCWHDVWLTPAALPMAKRDLAKIGVVRLEQLDQPLPRGILLRVKLALRKDDNGAERNRVTRFEAAGIEPSDPYAPADALPADRAAFGPADLDDDQANTAAPAPTAAEPAPTPNGCGRNRQRDILPAAAGNGQTGNGPYAEGR